MGFDRRRGKKRKVRDGNNDNADLEVGDIKEVDEVEKIESEDEPGSEEDVSDEDVRGQEDVIDREANDSQDENEKSEENERDGNNLNLNVIVLLEKACLETVKTGKKHDPSYQLLNCDDHKSIMRKNNRDLSDARPDIAHQCLLTLLDSPLNKSGKLRVYVRTEKNVLIEIHPDTRIPRTIKRFSGLIVELLQKLKVRATNSPHPLLKVIRNPITAHLPVGCRKIVCTYNCDNLVNIRNHASEFARTTTTASSSASPSTILYVVGAMAHGKVEEEWADEIIAVSEFPLSASTVCHRITSAYEEVFGIV